MVRRVLIVDSSQPMIELMRDHVLSMFPHVSVDLAPNVKNALSRMTRNTSGAVIYHEYDIIIVDEHCSSSFEGSEHQDQDSGYMSSMTGSQLLKLINDSELCTCSSEEGSDKYSEGSEKSSVSKQRRSLMIGVSTDMSEDCESLSRGGADLLWSKPPPKPSKCLRNQLLNTLLNKRGKSVFICGC